MTSPEPVPAAAAPAVSAASAGPEPAALPKLPNSTVRELKGRAQRLVVSIKLGKAGLTDALVASIDQELARHELVKIRLVEFQEQRRELARDLAARTHSHLLWVIGHVVVLFRPKPRPTEGPARRDVTGGRDARAR